MKTAKKITKKIDLMQTGTIFKYQQLNITPSEYSAATKAIERLITKGIVKRVSTGLFYKPIITVFGELRPREAELIKSYLFEKNNRIAYITGTALYNRMGLTTQVPNTIKLACRSKRISINTENVQAKPVKSYIDVTNDNYYLLEILDALKDFTKIPDLDKNAAIKYLLNKLTKLTEKDKSRIIKFSLFYPPRTRAFLGALFDKKNHKQSVTICKQSLNPLSMYKLGIKEDILSTAPNWNIL